MHATWQAARKKTISGAMGSEPESAVAGRAVDSGPDAVHDHPWYVRPSADSLKLPLLRSCQHCDRHNKTRPGHIESGVNAVYCVKLMQSFYLIIQLLFAPASPSSQSIHAPVCT